MTTIDISTDIPSFKKNLKRLKKLRKQAAYLEGNVLKKSTNGVDLLGKSKIILQKVDNINETDMSFTPPTVKEPVNVPEPPISAPLPKKISEEKAKIIAPKIKEISEAKREDVSFTVPSVSPQENNASQKYTRLMENYATGIKTEVSNYDNKIKEYVTGQKSNWLENSVTEFGKWAAVEQFRSKLQKLGITGALEWLSESESKMLDGRINPFEYLEAEEPEEFNEEFRNALGENDFYKGGYEGSLKNLNKIFNPQLYQAFVEEADDANNENALIRLALRDLPEFKNDETGKTVLKQSITDQLYQKYGKENSKTLAKQIDRYVDSNYNSLNLKDYRSANTEEKRNELLNEFKDTETIGRLTRLQGYRGEEVSKLTVENVGEKEFPTVVNKFVAELKINPKYSSNAGNAHVIAARLFGDAFEKYYDGGVVNSYIRSNPHYISRMLSRVNELIEAHNKHTKGNVRKIPKIELSGEEGEVKKKDIGKIQSFFKEDGERLNKFFSSYSNHNIRDDTSLDYLKQLDLMNRSGGLSFMSDRDSHAALFLDDFLTENRGQFKGEQAGKKYYQPGTAYIFDPDANSKSEEAKLYVKEFLNSPILMDPELLSLALQKNAETPNGRFVVLANEILPLITGAYYKGRMGPSQEQLAFEDYLNNPFVKRLQKAATSTHNFKEFVDFFNGALTDAGVKDGRFGEKKAVTANLRKFLDSTGSKRSMDKIEPEPSRNKTPVESIYFHTPDEHIELMNVLRTAKWMSNDERLKEDPSQMNPYAGPIIYERFFDNFYKLADQKRMGVNVDGAYANIRQDLLNTLNNKVAKYLFEEENNDEPYNYFAEVYDIKNKKVQNGVLEALYILKKFDKDFRSRLLGASVDENGVLNPDAQPQPTVVAPIEQKPEETLPTTTQDNLGGITPPSTDKGVSEIMTVLSDPKDGSEPMMAPENKKLWTEIATKIADKLPSIYNLKTPTSDVDFTDFKKEVGEIPDEGVRAWTQMAMDNQPEKFQKVISSDKFHPPDERIEGGNVRHTKRVFETMKLMIAAQPGKFGKLEQSMLLSAALLHDICREKGSGHAREVRPYYKEKLGEEFANKYPQLMNAIESHMGRWAVKYGARNPETDVEKWVHFADNIAAHLQNILPEETAKFAPSVKEPQAIVQEPPTATAAAIEAEQPKEELMNVHNIPEEQNLNDVARIREAVNRDTPEGVEENIGPKLNQRFPTRKHIKNQFMKERIGKCKELNHLLNGNVFLKTKGTIVLIDPRKAATEDNISRVNNEDIVLPWEKAEEKDRIDALGNALVIMSTPDNPNGIIEGKSADGLDYYLDSDWVKKNYEKYIKPILDANPGVLLYNYRPQVIKGKPIDFGNLKNTPLKAYRGERTEEGKVGFFNRWMDKVKKVAPHLIPTVLNSGEEVAAKKDADNIIKYYKSLIDSTNISEEDKEGAYKTLKAVNSSFNDSDRTDFDESWKAFKKQFGDVLMTATMEPNKIPLDDKIKSEFIEEVHAGAKDTERVTNPDAILRELYKKLDTDFKLAADIKDKKQVKTNLLTSSEAMKISGAFWKDEARQLNDEVKRGAISEIENREFIQPMISEISEAIKHLDADYIKEIQRSIQPYHDPRSKKKRDISKDMIKKYQWDFADLRLIIEALEGAKTRWTDDEKALYKYRLQLIDEIKDKDDKKKNSEDKVKIKELEDHLFPPFTTEELGNIPRRRKKKGEVASTDIITSEQYLTRRKELKDAVDNTLDDIKIKMEKEEKEPEEFEQLKAQVNNVLEQLLQAVDVTSKEEQGRTEDLMQGLVKYTGNKPLYKLINSLINYKKNQPSRGSPMIAPSTKVETKEEPFREVVEEKTEPAAKEEPVPVKFADEDYAAKKAFFNDKLNQVIEQFPMSDKESKEAKKWGEVLLNAITELDETEYKNAKRKLTNIMDRTLNTKLFPVADELMEYRKLTQ